METDVRQSWIELEAADGHKLAAFQAVPRKPRGTVVVLQEIFGVNHHIESVARRCADAGFAAVAPALFDRQRRDVKLRYDDSGLNEGKTLKAGAKVESALLDIDAALRRLGPAGQTAVIGFCWGGTLAWLAAARLQVRGAVAYYGGQIGDYLGEAPRTPLLTHFGEHDHSIAPAVMRAVSERYPLVLNHIYPAEHGFNCDERQSYHAESAALAWTRTTGFLNALF